MLQYYGLKRFYLPLIASCKSVKMSDDDADFVQVNSMLGRASLGVQKRQDSVDEE